MNDERPPGENGPGPEDPDAGEPTGVLEDFVHQAPMGFLDQVRNKIHRRLLASDVVDLSWRAPGLVLLQWLLIIVDFVRGGFRNQGVRPDE